MLIVCCKKPQPGRLELAFLRSQGNWFLIDIKETNYKSDNYFDFFAFRELGLVYNLMIGNCFINLSYY